MRRSIHPTKARRITTRRPAAERSTPVRLTVNRVIAANAAPHGTEVEVDVGLSRDRRSVVVQVKSQDRGLLCTIRGKLGYFRYRSSGCLVLCINLVDMLMNPGQPEMALEEVKRRAADRVIEVVEDVVKASSPTPVLVKVGNFSPLPLSGEELMEGPLLVMSTIRREVLCLLNRVKLDNLLVSSFRG